MQLTDIQKIAYFMIYLGEDAVFILQGLPKPLVQSIVREMSKAKPLSQAEIEPIWEFALAKIQSARPELSTRQEFLLKKLNISPASNPKFKLSSEVNLNLLAKRLNLELPSVVSVFLACCQPPAVLTVLKLLKPDLRTEALRITCQMTSVHPEALDQIHLWIAEFSTKDKAYSSDRSKPRFGSDRLAHLLSQGDSDFQKKLLGKLSEGDPILAEKVELALVTFETILSLSSPDFSILFKEIPINNWEKLLEKYPLLADKIKPLVSERAFRQVMEKGSVSQKPTKQEIQKIEQLIVNKWRAMLDMPLLITRS